MISMLVQSQTPFLMNNCQLPNVMLAVVTFCQRTIVCETFLNKT